MAVNYYIADGNQRRGPFRMDELPAQGLRPDSLVWREGMPDWKPAEQVEELRPLLGQAGPGPIPGAPPVPVMPGYGGYTPAFNRGDVNGKKLAAGICGILIGSLGIHKFILGMNNAGIIMLVVTLVLSVLTCGIGAVVMWVIGIVEGVVYLTKTDEEFYQMYIVEKKAWF